MRSDVTEAEILDAMDRFGGSFIRAMAQCFRQADVHNQTVLRSAFLHYFREYAELAALQKARTP